MSKPFFSRETIRLRDALAVMANGEYFSIGFCDFNEKAKTGGNYKELTNCVKIGQHDKLASRKLINIKVDGSGSHPVAVHTWLIMTFNNISVTL